MVILCIKVPRRGGRYLSQECASEVFERARGRLPVCQKWECTSDFIPHRLVQWDLVEAALFDHDVLPHDESMRGHLAQLGQNAADVLVGIDERNHDRQLTSGFDQVRGVDAAAPEEASYGVVGYGSKGIFFAQIFQYFQMQRTMVPGIAFGEVD